MSTEDRKLAAIVFTNICGYTELMGRDETKAMALLETQRNFLKPMINNFDGEWLKEIEMIFFYSVHSAQLPENIPEDLDRVVQIKSEDYTIKYGEIHPRTLEKFELGYPAIGGEIIW